VTTPELINALDQLIAQTENQADRYGTEMRRHMQNKLERIHRIEELASVCEKGQALLNTLEGAVGDESAFSEALIYLDVHVHGVEGDAGCEVCG